MEEWELVLAVLSGAALALDDLGKFFEETGAPLKSGVAVVRSSDGIALLDRLFSLKKKDSRSMRAALDASPHHP